MQFGAVTQEPSKPCRRPACQTRLPANGTELVCLTAVAQSEGPLCPGMVVRAATLTSAFSFLLLCASPSAQTQFSIAEIADDEPAG